MSALPDSPDQLVRFPAEVREAYQAFLLHRDASAVHVLVRAALLDFGPKRTGAAPVLEDRTRLAEDLGYDSLAIAELVFFVEDLFKVTITTNEIRHVATVGDLRSFVTRKLFEERSTA